MQRPTTAGARAQEGPGICEAGAGRRDGASAVSTSRRGWPVAAHRAHARRGWELGMDVAIVLGRRDAGRRVVPTDSRAGLLSTGLPPACYLSSSRRSSTLARYGTYY